MRCWCQTEAEAKKRLEEFKARDADSAQTQYWVYQLRKGDVQNFKLAGFIPKDA